MITRDFLSRAVSRLAERPWGEIVRIVPRITNPYGPAIADPDRDAQDVRGIVSIEQNKADIEGARRGPQMQGATAMHSQSQRLFITRERYDALGYEIAKEDMVVLTDRTPAQRFVVAGVDNLDAGDTLITLVPTDGNLP